MKHTFILIIASAFFACTTHAQEKKRAAASAELYKEIAMQDSLMFAAFNAQDMEAFKAFFAKDLEWYHDNDGLMGYEKVFSDFEANFKKPFKLKRSLVKGSLSVHPVKNFGAIETGSHQFSHMEYGKEIVGTFKFLTIWKKVDGKWMITRVVSYDH